MSASANFPEIGKTFPCEAISVMSDQVFNMWTRQEPVIHSWYVRPSEAADDALIRERPLANERTFSNESAVDAEFSDHDSEDSFLQAVANFIGEHVLDTTAAFMVQRGRPRFRAKRQPKAVTRTRPAASGSAVFNPAQAFSLGNNLSAFPLRIKRTLRYAQTNVIDVPNFGTSAQVFRANSLFDPDFTGTGHQPNGFDQLMVAYNHFTVVSARIEVRVVQAGTGGGSIEPGAIVVGYSDTGTFMASQADYATCVEKRNVMATGFYGVATSTGNAFVLRGALNVARLLGKTEQQIVEMANLRGNASANPVEGYFFELGLFSFSFNPGAITVVSTIEYDAVFTEPKFNSGDS